jgi:hypothetical protein
MGRRSRHREPANAPGAAPISSVAELARLVRDADAQALTLHEQLDGLLLERRRAGVSVTRLSQETGFSRTTLHKALNRAGRRQQPA